MTRANSPEMASIKTDAMCELLGMSSNASATVNFSLPKLAEHGAASGTYNDGWGVGYYEGLGRPLDQGSHPGLGQRLGSIHRKS